MARAIRLPHPLPPLPYSGEGRGGGSHAGRRTAPSLTLPRRTGRGDQTGRGDPFRLPFLPGRFVIERGSIVDYHALARFHYRPGKPATIAGVWVVRYLHGERSKTSDLAAVGVLSWPVPCVRERNLAFGLQAMGYGEKIHFANANLRTISRVIVHPVFRATGLATRLVRRMIAECPTPCVEALATMGWVHPFFERAGMTRVDPEDPRRPVYYYASKPPV